ncbi:MAG: hypothetical protein ISS17_08725 [Bacteroidales bacterium]|nr:hypothetical protein [Bacteroidales bacterium]
MLRFSTKLMYRLTIALFCIVLTSSLFSCRKCRECTATSWDGYEIAVKKHCTSGTGASKSLDTFEEDFRKLYSTYLVTCRDH